MTIMLLGHWQEMKAIGQAQGALAALAALLPDEAERIGADGEPVTVSVDDLAPGDVVLVRSGGRVPADGAIVRGDGRDGRVDHHRRVTPGAPRPRATRSSPAPCRPTRPSGCEVTAVGDDTTLAGIQRLVAEAQASGGRAQALADRFAALLFYVATAAGAGHVRGVGGAGRRRRGHRPHGHRAGHRLPARPRPRHPAGDLAGHGRVRPGRHPRHRSAGPRAHAHRRRRAVRQDRHPDQGRPRGHRRRRRPGVRPRRRGGRADRGRRRGRQRAPAGPGHRRPRPASGAAPAPPPTSGRSPGPGRRGHCRRRRLRRRRPGAAAGAGARRAGRPPPRHRRVGGAGRGGDLPGPRASGEVVGALALEDEVRPEARQAVADLRGWASTW